MENKKPYTNYAAVKPTKVAKQDFKSDPIESVAANAPVAASAVVSDTKDEIEHVTGEEVTVRFVNVDLLNVRSTPEEVIGNVIDQLKKDTKVNVIEEIDDFSKIGEGRYVMSKFLI